MVDIESSEIVWEDPESLKTSPDFKNFLPILDSDYDAIYSDMKKNGFLSHHPIVMWKEMDFVIDGHTRLKCAISLGITVAVVYLPFPDINSAKLFAYGEQRNRRDFSDSLLLRKYIDDVDLFNSFTNKKKAVMKILGVGESKANWLIQIVKSGNERVRSYILAGELTLRAAYSKLEKKAKHNSYQYKNQPDKSDDNISSVKKLDPTKEVHIQEDLFSIPFEDALEKFIESGENISNNKIPSDFNNHHDFRNHLNKLLSSGSSTIELKYVVNCLDHLLKSK